MADWRRIVELIVLFIVAVLELLAEFLKNFVGLV